MSRALIGTVVRAGWGGLALAGCWLFATPTSAATYFASPTGSGTTCSEASPCSLSQCVARVTANGDVCSAGDGTYTNPSTISVASSRACGTGAGVCTIKSTNRHGAVLDVAAGSGAVFLIQANNWVIDGFKVKMRTTGRFTFQATASDGFTLRNNRVEARPSVKVNEVIYVSGTSNVLIQNNWVHNFPGCMNGGESDGAGGNFGTCGGDQRCDFAEVVSGTAILLSGNGSGSPDTNVVFEGNDFGHWRNPASINNYSNVTIRRNICTNATNHGCFNLNDVRDVVMENNVADIDRGPGCSDEILQASLFDSYCYENVTIRNNTIVGQNIGFQQMLASVLGNACAASACNDGVLPEIGDDGTCYDHMYVYNNLLYDGKPSGSNGLWFQPANGSPDCCYSDYNLISEPSGGDVGWSGSTAYPTLPQWQTLGHDRNSTASPPAFTNYAGRIYTPLNGTAPQVNAGQNTSARPCPSEDFNRNPRSDGRCDIGAFEFQSGGSSSTPPGQVSNVTRSDVR